MVVTLKPARPLLACCRPCCAVLTPAPPQALGRHASRGSAFASGGLADAFRSLVLAPPPAPSAPRAPQRVEALHGVSGRKCMLTGKRANNGYTVSFSHRRVKTLQQPNLQYKRLFWASKQRWVRLRVSTNALKSVEKLGLEAMAVAAGLDLASLPFQDASPERAAWKAANPVAGGQVAPKVRRAPKFRPLGLAKPVYIPAWKTKRLASLPEAERDAKLQQFKDKWFSAAKAAEPAEAV